MLAPRMLVTSFLAVLLAAAQAGRVVSFDNEVKPLLEARCIKCHGPAMQLGKLDLRSRQAALKGGEKGPGFLAGNPQQSILFKRVAGLEKPAMPMDGKLTDTEVETLKLWIEQGAKWEGEIGLKKPAVDPLKAIEESPLPAGAKEWWSFKKPVRSELPKVSDERWSKHPIDAFIKQELDKQGLKPAPQADKRTLVRRAYLDLTGLPPTPAEVRQYVDDQRPDAWSQLVDRLLASPHYGERWGRHWLDVARYADSNGYEHDFDRPNAWRYRDYVIRSFNRDTPYDRFLLEQLAGDEVNEVTYDTLTATGFLRNYAKVGFREKDNPQFRFEYLDDMIATLGRGVMGITVHCARCHNHKFDPILQRDYYKLQASLYGYVEVEHPLVPKEQADEYYRQNEEIDARIKPLRTRVAAIEDPYKLVLVKDKYKRFPANVQEAIAVPEEQRTPGQALLANQIIRTVRVSSGEVARHLKPEEREEVQRLEAEIAALQKQRPKPIPTAMGITDGDYRFVPDGAGDEPAPGKGVKMEVTEGSFLHKGPGQYQVPPSYFLHGGDIYSRGSVMKPGFVTVITNGDPTTALPPSNGNTSGRRRALAEWFASPDHPLTARVMANRIWHHHFGRGIVATLDNYGKTGEKPTHPELLDWLAVEFRERGWSIKAMHRLIMNSQAYQMSSSFADEGNLAKDAANMYLWRFRQQRLEAEVLRDSILHVAGSLNTLMEGPAVFPPLPEETLRSMNKGIWKRQPNGPETWRRSVYVYRKRGLPFPFFEVFDLPDQTITCGRRTVSTVATQALTLLNNEFVLDQSKRFAARIQAMSADRNEQLRLAYEIALGRQPSSDELSVATEFLKKNQMDDLSHVLLNLSEFLYMR